jgi:hypothetical protein
MLIMAKSIPVHARLTPETYSELKSWAEEDRRPLAALISIILEDAIKDRRKAGV